MIVFPADYEERLCFAGEVHQHPWFFWNLENFLLCRYIKSVVLKVCHSLLVILVAVNFNAALLFIVLVNLVTIKTKSRKTNIWRVKLKKKKKKSFQAESISIIPAKASSFSRAFNFPLLSLCGMETGCQVVYMMQSRKKTGVQSMSGWVPAPQAGICLSFDWYLPSHVRIKTDCFSSVRMLTLPVC